MSQPPPWWHASPPPSTQAPPPGVNGHSLDLGMMLGRALQKLDHIADDVIWIKSRLEDGDERMDGHETRITVLEAKPAPPPPPPPSAPPQVEFWTKLAAIPMLVLGALAYTGSLEKTIAVLQKVAEVARIMQGSP